MLRSKSEETRRSSRTAALAIASVVVMYASAASAEDAISDVTFDCKDDKSIAAAFYTDKVDLTLSDGRSMSLPQTMSGSGIRYANADETRLYLDPRTGELIGYADAPSRAYRWWHYGLHRLDFSGLNARPLWDILMLPLMAGISLLCLLGMWIGWRRLRR